MAAQVGSNVRLCLLATSVVLQLCTVVWSVELEAPTLEIVSQWAGNVDKKLLDLNRIFATVNRIYQDKVTNTSWAKNPKFSFKYENLNETELVKEMANSLSQLLERHVRALEKSVEAAEKLASEYKWNSTIQKEDVNYLNAKELDEKRVNTNLNLNFTHSEQFNMEVSFDSSSVHIPVEIYDGNRYILNGLNWTAGLDEQFKKNREEYPDMLWQYFGSQTGFLRYYPAAQWPVKTSFGQEKVDLYDVRRRSWYTQGASSPKDMMILIDTSGSTHGQSLQLMQSTVKSILDTLGENDYVNIIRFAEEAEVVTPCFNHTSFVQANYRNKQQLIKDVDRLKANQQAHFSKAIKFAFQKFQEFNNTETNMNNIGAMCNKVIMLLTDGATDNAQEVFKEYNWVNKTAIVRVFTYAVGATPNPTKALRWMACANRGYFSQIPAMGAIRARVQEYIPVLSRPQVLMDEKLSEWGNIYEDHLNLGMMTTVTRPVYNYSRESSNQTILGVMGIDVTTAQLEAKTPHSKIGPNGYSFAINPNGYVVFHPNLYTKGEFMTEPPNMDFLEVEVEQDNKELEELRSNMIDGLHGSTTISTYFLSPDKRYITKDQADYGYVAIANTSFRLGLCVPTYQKKYPKFSGDISQFVWTNANSNLYKILISPWKYHKNMTRENLKELNGTLDDVITYLQKDSDPNNWNLDLLYHLYWDYMHIEPSLVDFLKSVQGKSTTFIMTNGGMTLVSPPDKAVYFRNNQDLRNNSIFMRALRTTKCIFMADYTEEKRSNTSETPYIITACGSYISEKNNQGQDVVVDKPAVAGERLDHQDVIEAVINATKTSPIYASCADSSLICYLVDDGGFLVATTGADFREQIGRFFGLVDPPVFSTLEKYFLKTVEYDFQATCNIAENVTSAGFKNMYLPSLNMLFELLNVGWWTSKVNLAYNSFNLYSWLWPPSTQVYANEEESQIKKCVEATYQYAVNSTMTSYFEKIECANNCTRYVRAVKLIKTNLLLIVAEAMCEGCDDLFMPVSQAPKEMSEEETEEIVCRMAKNPKKRLRAYECHHSHPLEDSSQCGCSNLQASRVLIGLLLVYLAWRLVPALR